MRYRCFRKRINAHKQAGCPTQCYFGPPDFKKLLKTRSRLYRGQCITTYSLTVCSIFRDLEELHTFAPRPIRNLANFTTILQYYIILLRCSQMFAMFVRFVILISKFDETLSEFRENMFDLFNTCIHNIHARGSFIRKTILH